MEFDTCITSFWKAETMAVSEAKARSNLAYQYKKQNNRNMNIPVTLPGKIKLVE